MTHPKTGSTWTHVQRGGEYVVVGVATVHSRAPSIDGREVVVYRDGDGELHTRSLENWGRRMEPMTW